MANLDEMRGRHRGKNLLSGTYVREGCKPVHEGDLDVTLGNKLIDVLVPI